MIGKLRLVPASNRTSKLLDASNFSSLCSVVVRVKLNSRPDWNFLPSVHFDWWVAKTHLNIGLGGFPPPQKVLLFARLSLLAVVSLKLFDVRD